MSGFIRKLQNKPYDQKIRILWSVIIISLLLIVVIWVLTLKFRTTPQGDTSKFRELINNVKKLR